MKARPGDFELLHPVRMGGTLLDVMWNDLIRCIDSLMNINQLEIDNFAFERLKGRAEGVAWCIAVMTQSPRPIDINAIKAEAMERWEAMQE